MNALEMASLMRQVNGKLERAIPNTNLLEGASTPHLSSTSSLAEEQTA